MPTNSDWTVVTHEVTLNADVTMVFCKIPSCNRGFLMGSRKYSDEQPIHRVTIPHDLWMGKFPVTRQQFAVWTESADFRAQFDEPHRNGFSGEPNLPAEQISWIKGVAFCEWLTKRLKSLGQFPPEIELVRLPIEAEWEYACRGDWRGKNQSEYFDGDGEIALAKSGWFNKNSGSKTHPVGRKKENGFGLHDMHGNVREWCLDRWDAAAYRRRPNQITAEQSFQLNERFGDQNSELVNVDRVLRGGSCFNTAAYCRSAYRFGFGAGFSDGYFGLRVCLVPAPISQ